MKYRDITWNLEINGKQAHFDDDALEKIALEIANGNTSGLFTMDITNYNKIDELKEKLECEIGREIDCNYEDVGELEDLLKIAKEEDDDYVVDLIEELLKEYE